MSERPQLRPRAYLATALGFVAIGLVMGLALSGSLEVNPSPFAQTPSSTVVTASLPLDEGIESPFVRVVDRALPAVVLVQSARTSRSGPTAQRDSEEPFGELFRRWFPERDERPRARPSSGSGFIVSPEGRILTNNHVVDGADEITVTLFDKRTFKAKIVGQDPGTDVAVIQIQSNEKLPFLPLGDSDKIRVGDYAIAIGNPLGELEGTVTAGIISAKGRSSLNIMGGGPDYQDFIQTDASINFGNSGGPLMNTRGEVVGINTAINPSGRGIGFAIPVNLAKHIADQLVAHGKVVRGYMGVLPGEITHDLAESLNLQDTQGVIINQVVDDSPAARAGFKTGDIVTAFDGRRVRDVTDFRLKVADAPVDKRVRVDVLREGKPRTLYVTLADRDVSLASQQGRPRGAEPEPETAPAAGLGLRVRDMARGEASDYANSQGVIVEDVDPGSPAALKGIGRGDLILEVNGRKVENTGEFSAAIRQARDSKRPVRLLVGGFDGGGNYFTRFVAVRFEDDE